MSTLNTVSLQSVKYAALLLIEINGTATSLEVKNLLRDLNVYAIQSEISTLLEQAANELPLAFETQPGKNYKTYSLPSVSSTISVPHPKLTDLSTTSSYLDTGPSSNMNNPYVHTKRSGTPVILFDTQPKTGLYWKINCGDISNMPSNYVDALKHTRDDGRAAYSKRYNVSYNCVHGKKVGNE